VTVVVIGAGGHAKVVVATLQAAGRTVAGIYDDDPNRTGTELMGIAIRGPADEAVRTGLPMVIAVGDNRVRLELARRLQGEFTTAVHPGAIVHPSCRIDPGTVVFAGAVLQPDSTLGKHVIVNTGASIDHDCRVGAFSHLAPGVRLCGNVVLGEGAFLGVASAVVPDVRIGEWSVVGAGAVVTADVEPRVTVVGIPARTRAH
jgi:sugar O-acyltransferase (sialic acid O-acetyltransferase NeuD family)